MHPTPLMVATYKLVARLCSVSILYASEASSSNEDGANHISDNPDNGLMHHHVIMMVEGIMQSLTHTKGNVLSQMLLLPWDCGGWGGRTGLSLLAAATAKWNAIGGLSNAKELLLDLAFPLLPMLSCDMGRDLKTEFLQLWVAMAMVAAMVLMGRRSG